jgi:acylphosphatase
MAKGTAFRAVVRGRVQGVGFRASTVERARELGVLGWARNEDDGSVAVHAEGEAEAVEALLEFLREGPSYARVDGVEFTPSKVEGHEQFAVRGVPAGRFVVEEHAGDRGASFVLRLEVDRAWRAWTLSKAPSLAPSDRRFASELPPGGAPDEPVGIFDTGPYEQGGRVPWPEAIARGHAVFVLHGGQLRGGFALQRTRGEGPGSGWLLIKRRDEHAAAG